MRWPTANTELSVAVFLKQVDRHGCALFLVLIIIQGSFGTPMAGYSHTKQCGDQDYAGLDLRGLT